MLIFSYMYLGIVVITLYFYFYLFISGEYGNSNAVSWITMWISYGGQKHV